MSSHPLQRRVDESPRQTTQGKQLAQLQSELVPPRANGLPSQLRAGIEALSGMDMGDVVLHRNSSKPAQLNAHAYAQGNEIHLGPGQEKHLPHEAWHVVQQKQFRVRPTTDIMGEAINTEMALEHEADVMGQKASAQGAMPLEAVLSPPPLSDAAQLQPSPGSVIQGNFFAWLRAFFPGGRVAPVVRTLGRTRLYRADTRGPEEITRDGFSPRTIRQPASEVTQEDIASYQRDNSQNPGIVSTASDEEGAITFAGQRASVTGEPHHLYEINGEGLPHLPQNRNIPFWQRLFYSEQRETMVPGTIPRERIQHVRRIEPGESTYTEREY